MAKIRTTKNIEGLNPIIAMLAVIFITAAMVTVTTIIFLRSSAYATVKQIRLGIEATDLLDQDDVDVTSPINATDIDTYSSSLFQRLDALDDYKDFGPDTVSDTTLGL